MALTFTISLPCGHKLGITVDFLAYDVITCRTCHQVHKFPRKQRQNIARQAGWNVDTIGKWRTTN